MQQSDHVDSQKPQETSSETNGSVLAQHGRTEHDTNTRPDRHRSGRDTGSRADHAAGPTAAGPDVGLRVRQTPSPPHRDRISEYEKTPISGRLRKRQAGPSFEVVRKSRQDTSPNGNTILDLPNEILTHVLANLSPADLVSVSITSKRLHELVTTQHAWRAAFARYFSGPDALLHNFADDDSLDDGDDTGLQRREFARLTTLASWRSEYILRTRLLRSLARGKPVQTSGAPATNRSGVSHVASPTLLYNTQMYTTVNHIQASFGTGLNARQPILMHGADDVGSASVSDPLTGKSQGWGLNDPLNFVHFADRFPGDAMYGLGTGQMIGVPNMMAISQPHGMVYGEGLPGGSVYLRPVEEPRGRFLSGSSGMSFPEAGVPKILSARESQCSVWIAKSAPIPALTDGMIGVLAGSSLGVLTAYSLGPLSHKDQRHQRGEMTARWVLCPGIPIVALAVDEHYSASRLGHGRIWAVVLNALGEVYYATDLPKQADDSILTRSNDEARECRAWATGRSIYWNLLESTRREARPNPYRDNTFDGSYSPRSSWKKSYLSKEQLKSETHEIEAYLAKKPAEIQSMCLGWDMRRRLEVDFAADDGNDAGETIVILNCGLEENTQASIKRHVRRRQVDTPGEGGESALSTPPAEDLLSTRPQKSSLFGGGVDVAQESSINDIHHTRPSDKPRGISEEWHTSELTFGGLKGFKLTTSTMDESTFATTTIREDPFLSFSGASITSSPSLTPISADATVSDPQDIPGQRARLLAVGNSMGSVLVYNIRNPTKSVAPLRIIHTESPSISCLALSSLYLVIGGTDGFVQAWDPLASTTSPIRTLHSRFSSRARRRLAQAAASPQGIGINLWAAGAIALDPDPTSLRGVVSLGTHLFYWHFSSSAADAYRSHKRRLRRSERLDNSGGERYVPTPRAGGVKRFIENEKWEIEREEERDRRETARMAGRFGTDLLGESASEEDMLAYAALLSQEAFDREMAGSKSSVPAAPVSARQGSDTSTAAHAAEGNGDYDADIAEAIKQSLSMAEHAPSHPGPSSFDGAAVPWPVDDFPVPFKYAKNKRRPSRQSPHLPARAGGSADRERDEVEFALELSMAEERSRTEALAWESYDTEQGNGTVADEEEFPGLPGRGTVKGKGRAR